MTVRDLNATLAFSATWVLRRLAMVGTMESTKKHAKAQTYLKHLGKCRNLCFDLYAYRSDADRSPI